MDQELLLEIGCEEIPASWLPALTRQLGERLMARLTEARLDHAGAAQCFSTPRRLTARVARVAERQRDLEETLTGPPASAAFGAGGQPTAAAQGFARKHGVDVSQLIRVDTPKGLYLAYHRRQSGAPAREVLASVLAATLRDLAFPQQMHWDAWLDDGRGELVFGRPIRWLLYLHGGAVVPFMIHRTPEAAAPEVQPVESGSTTYGHRFFSKAGKAGRPFKVRTFVEYRTKLSEQFVIIDRDTRQRRIARKLDACAAKVGGRVARTATESTLLSEVPDLVEYPSVVVGSFPKEFLQLPAEILTTTMIHHQHYFPVVDKKGKLRSNFLAVTNTPRDNVPAIAQNAERVLVARLRDARFFWEADRASTLASRLDRLDTLLFHKKMGSYRAKVERLEPLAGWIAAEALESPGMADSARAAARLCKADLTTDMVGEFAELQGIMGGIYAREEGAPEEVWRAVYHHYLPLGVEADALPTRKDLGRAAVSWAAGALAGCIESKHRVELVGERHRGP